MKKAIFTEEVLRDLIFVQKLSKWEIAKTIPCSPNSVVAYMKRYKIESPKGFHTSGRPRKTRKLMTEEERIKRAIKYKEKVPVSPFKGCKHTDKTKAQMSANHADFTGDKNPFKKAATKNPQLLKDSSERVMNFWADKSQEEKYQIHKRVIYGDISKNHWSNIVSNAGARNLEFNITPEYIWNIWLEQNECCKLSGIKLNLKSIYEITASLDRIDSSKGYIEGNIQWLHKDVNIMKWTLGQSYFISLCKQIAENN